MATPDLRVDIAWRQQAILCSFRKRDLRKGLSKPQVTIVSGIRVTYVILCHSHGQRKRQSKLFQEALQGTALKEISPSLDYSLILAKEERML
jgi:hypothetical protein